MPSLFDPYELKNLKLKNRITLSPMCQYMATNKEGIPENWHMIHLVSRAIGGTGLILTEMTNVEPRGRITEHCLGIYNEEQVEAFKRINEEIHKYDAKSGLQLAHAGRKSVIEGGDIVAPSSISFSDKSPLPRELKTEEIERIVELFAEGAKRTVEAGFDTIELHGAHGYLIHQFLSPASNQRTDKYGEHVRFAKEVIQAVKAEIPSGMPLIMRISAVEYNGKGYTFDDMLEYCKTFIEAGVDMFDVSTGGDSVNRPDVYPGYQTSYAKAVREKLQVPVMSVGRLEVPEVAEMVIKEGHADMVSIGRGMLRDPYWAKEAAEKLGYSLELPGEYNLGYM
ncbi:NADH:flavin oxidoreductase/NADH oxidase [Oceanobacillus alkalisoli]|uniref:NADH:flavin oxidoreductase/NADH oxidase n=1 Tax=Oceanobacillus alkalisoli TaxID=2925113 RepID=UPI001EE49C05|nr:NADH:flavin oxidoreductase/NADH oxidase [Oceanobacillus alkalisoli]MCG5105380.1 NADH:flavin oxidoreductase/NADH oxidase [Oceanobacillus alkalisoli]